MSPFMKSEWLLVVMTSLANLLKSLDEINIDDSIQRAAVHVCLGKCKRVSCVDIARSSGQNQQNYVIL